MENEAQAKILQLLDVISVEVAANRGETSSLRNETSSLRDEMRAGFGRVERRLGNLEIRVESVETELRVVHTDLRAVESRLGMVESDLGSFRGEFERRIAPLERDRPAGSTVVAKNGPAGGTNACRSVTFRTSSGRSGSHTGLARSSINGW